MSVAIIVQARMTSTRLPGKVLLPLGGLTVLEHVLQRCMAVANADTVCCAVPDMAESTPLIEIAERMGVAVYAGSEADVLDRYWRAAKMVDAKIVLRVTSDCPMIDPEICGRVLALVRNDGADFASNNMPRSWPHGLDCEAVTMAWLARAAAEAAKPTEREHVTPWIRNHPDVRKTNLPGPGGAIAGHRWTLDTSEDYDFFQTLWRHLPDGSKAWDYRVPLGIVEKFPEIAAINTRAGS